MKGFSPVCTMICLFISLWFFINLLQIGHPNCPAPILTGSICKISRQKKVEKKRKKKSNFFILLISISWNSMNISNMWITMASASKSPWAVVTWVWFLPCMNPNMLFHIALILHNLIAKRTFVLSGSKPNWFNLQNKQTEKVEKNKSNYLLFHQHFNSMNISNMRIQIARMRKSF